MDRRDEAAPRGRARRGRGFSKRERERGAEAIERRTAWLAWPLAYWAGSFPEGKWPAEVVYRPAAELVAAHLRGASAGLYAVRLDYTAGVNPRVAEAVLVSKALIADTVSAVQAASKYPKALPKRVGNLEAWRAAAERRLQVVSRSVAAGAGSAWFDTKDAAAAEYRWAGGVASPAFPASLTRAAASPWLTAYAGLVGRACAFCDSGPAIGRAAWWLETARSAFPQRNGAAGLVAATVSLQHWLGISRWSRPNLERLFDILARIAPRVFGAPGRDRYDAQSWEFTVRRYGIVGGLVSLAPEQETVLTEYDLLPQATRVLRDSPSRLGLLASLPSRWLGAGIEGLDLWARLVSLDNRALVSRLVAWLEAREPSERPLRFLDDLLYVLEYRSAPGWQGLLERHIWLCEELLERYPWSRSFRDGVFSLFAAVAAREKEASPLGGLARALLSDLERYSTSPQDLELSSELAGANADTFLRLLGSAAQSDSGEVGDAKAGWSFLKTYPDVRQFLGECASEAELTGRVWRLLQRLDLALRLQSRSPVQELLSRWRQPGSASVPGDLAEQLALLAACRPGEPLPKSIAGLVEQPQARRREIARLREMERLGGLSAAARRRLENLERYEADEPAAAEKRIGRLRRICAKELRLARLAALEAGLEQAIEEHWRQIGLPPGVAHAGADWENALHLYVHIRKNRRILKKLLVEEARGSRGWMREHPANTAFLEWMRASGLDSGPWLADRSETHEIDGGAWTVYAETDPLRVLQMGNIFSTCLSVTGVNAFSTVANAAEANKRVLYIRNQRGAIIGRRLIGLGKHETGAVLVGFHCYGACGAEEWSPSSSASPWVKILFDRFCSRLAREVGAAFTMNWEVLDQASATLPLFASWYNDGPESWDEWVADPRTREAVIEGDRGAVAQLLTGYSCASRQSAIRALIWMGDEALALLEALGAGAFTSGERRFIERWTQGAGARALAGEWMRLAPEV